MSFVFKTLITECNAFKLSANTLLKVIFEREPRVSVLKLGIFGFLW